jgi:hypothetical protein
VADKKSKNNKQFHQYVFNPLCGGYMVADLERVGASYNCALLDFRLVVMSLAMYANRRVVVMSHCRSVQIEGLVYKPSDRATSRQRAARQRDNI